MTGSGDIAGGQRDRGLKHVLWGLALCLGLVVAVVTSVTAQADDSPAVPPPQITPADIEEGVRSGSSPEYRTELTNPQAAEELPHQELDREQAVDLMQSVFDPLLQAPAGIFNELEVERFLSDTAAILPAGEQLESSGAIIGAPPSARYEGPTLIESTTPLRTEGPGGSPEVVDLGLEHAEGELQPASPLVEVGIPQDLGEGIELPETGIRIGLEGAPADLSPSTVDQSVAAYPEVAKDTSLAVAPTPTGLETMTMLQSADAPTSQTFNLDLPQGASLQATEAGGAEVSKDGQPLLGVAPPSAIDAAGEDVPVDLTVAGNALTLTVSPEAGTSLPILVDPLYETYNWWNGITGLGGWGGWTNAAPNYYRSDHANCTTYASPYACQTGETSNAPGLFIGALPGSVSSGSTVNWEFPVPRWAEEWAQYGRAPQSYIASMYLGNIGFWQRSDWAVDPTLWMGLWNTESGGWVPGLSASGNYPGYNGNFGYEFNSGGNTHAKIASFSLVNPSGYDLTAFRDAFVNTAVISLADTGAPSLDAIPGPKNWVNQMPTEPIAVTARDLGLGVYRLKVAAENVPQSSGWPVQTMPCTGTTIYPCKGASTFTLTKHGEGSGEIRDYNPSQMPQGADNMLLTAEDPLGNKSETKAVKIWVDHSAPSLSLSGSATEQAKAGTNASQYTLKYSASDGDSATPVAGTPFGSAGTGPGQMGEPKGIATDSSGNLWVVDRANERVMKYDSNGNFLMQFGSAGSGNGQFSDPRAIAIAPNGTIWVSDMGSADGSNNNVQAFNSSGQFIRKITNESFSDPYGIATGPGGVLWVSDITSDKLFEFNETGTFIRSVAVAGGNEAKSATGLATDAAGNVWLLDYMANRVQKYNSTGSFLMQFGSTGTGNGQLENPVGIAVAPSGNLLVTDSKSNRVQVFQPNGTYLRQFGSTGSGAGQLSTPVGIALGAGNTAVVVDSGNHRVARWTHADRDPQSGVVSTEVKVDGNLVEPKYSPGCATENCSISREWMLKANAYSSGQHTVKVTATDGVGLSTAKEFTITTDTTPPELIRNSTFFSAAAGWLEQKSYAATASASDTGGSGVNSLTLKIDGKVVSAVTQSCPNKACGESFSPSINMASYKGGAHPAELIATDVAGNTNKYAWTINVDPKGEISTAEAINTLEASDKTAESTVVAPNSEIISQEEREDGNDPALVATGGGFTVKGAPTETEIPGNSSAPITIPTPQGELQIDPVGTPVEGKTVVANESATVTPNTSGSVDTVIRPVYDGFLAFANIRTSGAPEKFSWEVIMGKGQSLVQVDEKTAEVVYPEDGTVNATIHAEPAHDATGKELSTSVAVEGSNVVTLTVHHKVEGVVYPVTGGPGFQVGYETVTAFPPPEEASENEGPGEGEIQEIEISAPEPATASDAGVEDLAAWRGKIQHRKYRWIQCKIIPEFPDVHLRTAGGRCGNPFTRDEGEEDVAFNYGIRGDYYIVPGQWVKHRGTPTEHIECDKMYDGDHINQGLIHWTYFIDPARECKWYGHTQYGDEPSAKYGKHITPFGEWLWGSGGSQGNENWYHHQAGLALYIWASKDGYVGHHNTTCIDC
jgi:NHL repeat